MFAACDQDSEPQAVEACAIVDQVEEVERARQREIAAYLSAASFPPDLPSGPTTQPFINADSTLNALVQLGALRLDCDRAFLSLIDREYQWVAAEITRSHSIREMRWDGDDRCFLGVAKLDAGWGVCPTTMKAFMDDTGAWIRTGPNVIANRTRYIVNDFRTDPAYSERPYVKNFPYFVSYLEVPLVSPLGYLLGSYCVVDNRLHEFDDDETVGIMNDIAAAIMCHLENMRIRQSRDRSEQLIRGLGNFIASEPAAAGEPLSGDDLHGKETAKVDVPGPRPRPPPHLTPSSTIVSSGSIPSLLGPGDSAGTPLTSLGDEPSDDVNPMEQVVVQDVVEDNGFPVPASHQESPGSGMPEIHASGFISSANIRSAFFRAATTIRQTMDLDGLMFLDAVPSRYVDQPSSIHDPSLHEGVAGPFCAAIVQSSTGREPDLAQHTRLPEAVLQRLIQGFPRGHVFSADEFGPIDESYCPGKPFPGNRTDRELRFRDDVSTLFRVLPSARYIVFLPLWHYQRECWYAATLGWVVDATHALDMADVNLLTAFGNSAMAEVSRMEALAASRAKSSFVSSISHELRSPLHGIMASSELLRGAVSDPWLLSILDMLDSCGKTLLDTFNNLLDHAITIKDGKGAAAPIPKRQVADLAGLVEDVVEAVHFSHLSERAFQSSLDRTGVPTYSRQTADATQSTQPAGHPLVTLSIAKSTWQQPIDVGAWKRIVMNIFGNALKYTKAGRIEVGLSVVQRPDREGNLRDYVCLRVEDTGRGMSSDYLKYRLFTPFSQEDTYSPGIGLGLSIVQQLTKGLGGTINIKSSVGVGTVVEVCLPLMHAPGLAEIDTLPASISSLADQDRQVRGRTLCIISAESYASVTKSSVAAEYPGVQAKRAALLERAFRLNAGDILGMNVVVAPQDESLPPADVYLLDGDIIERVSSDPGSEVPLPPVSPLVMLCARNGTSPCPGYGTTGHIFHLHHPIGPKKLETVFSSALNMKQPLEPVPDIPVRCFNTESASDLSPPSVVRPLSIVKPGLSPGAAETPKPPGPIAPPLRSSPASRILNLLLVDDNPINLKLLAAAARKLKHKYSSACHGLEAVQLYKAALEGNQLFDTVFMDLSMPVLDGFEAIREIRRLETEMGVAPCKIAALTGLSSEVSRKQAFASGSDLFLIKPVKLDAVKKLLDEQLDGMKDK